MLVSRNLLIKYCKEFSKVNDIQFIESCNKIGIEVEQILTHPKTEKLEVVKIISIRKHPNADKLNLVTILTKKGEKEIVCGASNLELNNYAIYANIGIKLFNGLILEKKKIRDIYSEGMLCAYSELTNIGIDNLSPEDSDGIILFNKKIDEKDINSFLGLDDKIYDISIPSNRNDLNSIFSLLSELSFHLNLKFKLENNFTFKKIKNNIKITKDDSICNDIGIIEINNLQNIKPSWFEKEILMSSNFKINNNFIDILNIIFLLSANPLHCYNNENINSDIKIEKNNKIIDLIGIDSKTYSINKNWIIAKAKNKIISLPYVIGANEYKYNTNSNKVLIEIGNFNHLLVRAAMNEMKITTKASLIGNKPVSNWNTQLAFKLLLDYLNIHKIIYSYNFFFSKLENKKILIDFKKVESFIGTKINKEDIVKYFSNSSFNLNGNTIQVHPSRLDIFDEFDIYEEIMKFIDINKLPTSPITFNVINFKDNHYYENINLISDYLVDSSFFEVKTYNLTSKQESSKFDYLKLHSDIKILNPISNKREYLKSNAINEMFKVIQYNNSRKRDLYNIFELSKIQTDLDKTLDILNIIIYKDFFSHSIGKVNLTNHIINVKSFLSSIFKKINIEIKFKIINTKIVELIFNKKIIGVINLIDLNSLKEYDLDEFKNVASIIINLDFLKEKNEQNNINITSSYPYIKRDINISLKDSEDVNLIIEKIKKLKYILSIELKDSFKKENDITYTYSLVISNNEKTLLTDEINLIMDEVKKILTN